MGPSSSFNIKYLLLIILMLSEILAGIYDTITEATLSLLIVDVYIKMRHYKDKLGRQLYELS